MATPRKLATVGELRRLGRMLHRWSQGERATHEMERAAHREDRLYMGRSIGLGWAAQAVERRMRELSKAGKRGGR